MPFSMTERDLDWLATAPARHSQSTVVSADPAAVFAVLADHVGWAAWFPGITRVVPGPQTEGVGATRTVHLGPVKIGERFVAWEPGARFSFTGTSAGAPGLKSLVEDLQLTPAGEGRTTVQYTIGGQAPGPSFLNPGVTAILRRIIGGGLKGLEKKLG